MTVEPVRVSPDWLSLREGADAAARAVDLADEALRRLPGSGTVVVHDLGCGTGSMGRWLAPQLPRAQHWVLYDRDAELLEHAARQLPRSSASGAAVTVETRHRDVSRLPRAAHAVGHRAGRADPFRPAGRRGRGRVQRPPAPHGR